MVSTDKQVASMVSTQLRNRVRQVRWSQDPQSWAQDVLGVHLWSKQREIAQSVVENKRTVVASCHGTGKALAVDTPIAVPGGYSPMGDLSPGDQVLGSDGEPTTVVATTGVHTAPRYLITLEGPLGVCEITASPGHLWPVLTSRDESVARIRSARCGMRTHTGLWYHRTHTMSTRDIVRHVSHNRRLIIPGPKPSVDLRGVSWDPDPWVQSIIYSRGSVGTEGEPCLTWRTLERFQSPEDLENIRNWFKERGVHTLLRRTRLKGGVEWNLSVKGNRILDFLKSLDDRSVGMTYETESHHPGWRVVSARPCGEGPVQCIQVDAPDHLYLCTEENIPTHNSMIASVLSCWWVSTNPIGEAIVVSSAPTYAQVNKILWEEIRKHHATARRRGLPLVGRVTQGDEWKTSDGQILAFGRKPADGDKHAFQGIHRLRVLVVLDECCGVPEELWTGAEAITTGDNCRILAIGNPDDRNTEFGKAFLDPNVAQDWNRISVPAFCTPNFTGEKVPPLLNESLVSKSWVEERMRSWGDKDPRYISKVKAEFPQQSESSLFSPDLIASSLGNNLDQPKGQIVRLGVDVARFGTDQNIVFSYVGTVAQVERAWSGTDTVSSAYQVLAIAEEVKERQKAPWVEIRVDAVGLGAGVIDTLNARSVLLAEPWFSVYEMHGSAAPPVDIGGSTHGYGNARAYWYDQLRQSMRNGSVRAQENERLKSDLGIIFYRFKSGKLFIVSKEDMKKVYGKSPDYADALAYATAPVVDSVSPGTRVSQSAEDLTEELDSPIMEAEISIAPF